jgi:predicted nucleic acid-binding protein
VIVVDTNVIAYLFLEGEQTQQAEAVYQQDPEWVAPYLWRSEFRNVLALYLRQGYLCLEDAIGIYQEAETLMQQGEYAIDAIAVLQLTFESGCSAYDCEYVVLAQQLGVPLITADRKLIASFPLVAIPIATFLQNLA